MNINQLTDTLNKLSIISPSSHIVVKAKTWRPSELEESEFHWDKFTKIKSITIEYTKYKGENNKIILEVEWVKQEIGY